MIILLILYLTLSFKIEIGEGLKCYSCKGGQECGLKFSPKSSGINITQSPPDESLHSCSISVTPEGLTTRDVVPSFSCRSSSYQYCCNEDLCNSLLSPPLPALTSLKCAVGTCSMTNGICITDAAFVTVLSSAIESCSITFGSKINKSYRKACQPTVNDASHARFLALTKTPIFCCNSPECNREIVTSGVSDPAIECYTCDSRITGPEGCSVLNESSQNVYKAGSSSHHETCATITGLAGKDAVTKKNYPAFTIRTFVYKCVSKSLGTVSYGGATFRGRIDCCSGHFCNTKNFNDTKRRLGMKSLAKICLLVSVIILILGLIGAIIYFVNRSRQNKPDIKYDECATNEVQFRLKTLKDEHIRQDTNCYPDPSTTP